MEEQIQLLPRLWRYSLLSASLSSRANSYPKEFFLALVGLGRSGEAIGLAELLVDSDKKLHLLCEIGIAMYQRNEREGKTVIQRAHQIAMANIQIADRNRALRSISKAFTHINCWEDAQATALTIDNEQEQATTVRDLALTQAQNGYWNTARSTILLITHAVERSNALRALVQMLAQEGEQARLHEVIEEARANIQYIVKDEDRHRVLHELSIELTKAGFYEVARSMIGEITTPGEQVTALAAYAAILARIAGPNHAIPIFAEARSLTTLISDGKEQAWALSTLTRGFAEAGLWTLAQETANSISMSADRDGALHILTERLALAKEWDKAIEISATIADPVIRALSLRTIALKLAQTGQTMHARTVFEAAEETTLAIPVQDQTIIFRAVTSALAQVRMWKEARRTASKLVAVPEDYTWALHTIAKYLCQAHLWKQAHDTINELPTREVKVIALCNLCIYLIEAQLGPEAEAAFAAARQSADTVTSDETQAHALASLAEDLIHNQHWAAARCVTDMIEAKTRRLETMRLLGYALIEAQQWSEAQIINGLLSHISRINELDAAIAIGLARSRQWEAAQNAISGIMETSLCDGALVALAAAFTSAGQWNDAGATVIRISDEQLRVRAEIDFATALVKNGRWEEAKGRVYDFLFEIQLVEVLCALAVAFVQYGQTNEASLSLQEAYDIASKLSNTEKQDTAFHLFLTTLIHTQRWEEAITFTRTITENRRKRNLSTFSKDPYQTLAKGLMKAGRWREAQTAINAISEHPYGHYYIRQREFRRLVIALVANREWSEARQIIAMMYTSHELIEAYIALGVALSQNNLHLEAIEALILARDTAVKLSDMNERFHMLCTCAVSFSSTGMSSHTFETLIAAKAIIGHIRDKRQQAELFRELVATFARAQFWSEAQELAAEIMNDEERAEVLHDLVVILVNQKRWKEAFLLACSISNEVHRSNSLFNLVASWSHDQYWEEALTAIQEIKDREIRANGILLVIKDLINAGFTARAVNLLRNQWRKTQDREFLLALLQCSTPILREHPEITLQITESFSWVDAHLVIG